MAEISIPGYAIVPPVVDSATLLHEQDFESTTWANDFRSGAWQGKVDRATADPHTGTYALRGNLKEGSNDPITGLPGEGNPQLEFVGSEYPILSQTNDVFVRYWRRFDHSTWDGTAIGHGKNEYLVDPIVGVAAYFTAIVWETGEMKLQGNGAWWQADEWGNNYALVANSSLPYMGNADGQWHKFEYYFNYDENYLQIWIDGYLMEATGSSIGYFVDGKIPLHVDFQLRGLQFLYVDDAQVVNSTDGDGYACGYQYDDIEVWDGLPIGVL